MNRLDIKELNNMLTELILYKKTLEAVKQRPFFQDCPDGNLTLTLEAMDAALYRLNLTIWDIELYKEYGDGSK